MSGTPTPLHHVTFNPSESSTPVHQVPLFEQESDIVDQPTRGRRLSDETRVLVPRRRSRTPSMTRKAHGISETDQLNNLQVFAHLFKASVGTGVLAMPAAARDGGLLVGTLGIFLVALVIIHSMQLLVCCAQFLRRQNELSLEGNEVELDYPETVRQTIVFVFGPDSRVLWLCGYLQLCLCLTQGGTLSVYLLFVSQNTKVIVDNFNLDYKPPLIFYQVIFGMCFLPLVFVKTLSKISFLSGFANLLGAFALGLIMVYCLLNLQPVGNFPLVKDFSSIPLFFGVIVFAFESIVAILPIENKMVDKASMPGFGGVLNLSNISVVALYTAFAFYGYLCFGETVQGAITYSMPMSPWYFMISQPIYAVSIFITYSIQFYVAFAVLWDIIEPRLTTQRALFWGDALLRVAIVSVTFALAASIPHVEHMISLIGAFSGSSLNLIIPPLLHSLLLWKKDRYRPWLFLIIAKNIGVSSLGILGAIIGTYTSITAIIEAFAS